MRNVAANLALACFLTLPAAAQSQPSVSPRSSTGSTVPVPTAPANREEHDSLLDLPELPPNTVTLIGATIVSLDEVMNRMVVQPFGGKQRMKIAFDTRTHFYQDGKPTSYRNIREGQRIYFDSQLNGSTVFAKTIWIRNTVENGMGRGQILEYDPARNVLTVRDELSNEPIKMRLTSNTKVLRGTQPGSAADLVPGALVAMDFGPQKEVQQVTLLAEPGTTFIFAGRITYLDMSRKLIAVDNRTDKTKYDISIEAIPLSILRQLREGSDVNISAVFDGSRYSARSIVTSNSPTSQE